MTSPDYPRLATVIRAVLTRMVLNEPPTEEEPDADDRIRQSLDRRPD
jgi:hypothetical protein